IGKLARLAVDLGLAGVFKKGLDADKTIEELKKTSAGRDWLDAMDKAKDPWFYLSTGTGFYHTHTSWIDDLNIPFDHIRTYIPKVEKGESIARPLAEINAERDKIVAEYMELLPTEEDKKRFTEQYNIVRRTYPYAENHLFYVEHWHHTIWWNKIRDLGQLLVNNGFFEDKEDIFYFHRFDIPPMLYDLVTAWAVGPRVPARGPKYWKNEVKWRKDVFKKFRAWAPPPALGPTPEVVTEPFTIMLWGVTTDTVKQWLAPAGKPEELTELHGMPASPGVAEGPARVILEISELRTVQPGEILVCPITSPSWAPVFTKIKAAVTDIGGMSCHAAIVSREYRLPAVVGTGYATKAIKTGDKLKVNANEGVVYIER
ncbi:MAG: PEP-utilizing enzyme, partial [Anaerolineae bacterium]|nr:PEP-utilizing enzyme [Anaerolineae bacterium]